MEEHIGQGLIYLFVAANINEQHTIFTDKLENYPTIIVNAEGPLSSQFATEFVCSKLRWKWTAQKQF